MKPQKCVYESFSQGPVKCKILGYYSEQHSTIKAERVVELEVTATGNETYPKGYKFFSKWQYVWLKGKYLPNSFKIVYEGKPAWNPDKPSESLHDLAIKTNN
jgi:hypothetical protein